jgi:L-lactate dehydrogenase complex protein LldE
VPKAQLFITCLGDQFYTSTLQNMTRILKGLGVEVVFPPEQTCCGQPLFKNSFEDKTRPVAANTLFNWQAQVHPISSSMGCISR